MVKEMESSKCSIKTIVYFLLAHFKIMRKGDLTISASEFGFLLYEHLLLRNRFSKVVFKDFLQRSFQFPTRAKN